MIHVLFLLLTISISSYAQSELDKYIEKSLPKIIESYKRTTYPEYNVPLFKIANRFQGSTIFLDNQSTKTVPISVSMIDIQFMRYSQLFGIFRIMIQTPIVTSSRNQQENDIFLQNLNNTSIGIAGGGGWYAYDSRKVETGKGLSVLLSFFGYYNIGIANSIFPDDKRLHNGGAEFNLRVEKNFHRHFGMIYGFDIGYSNLHSTEIDTITSLEKSLGTVTIYYGAVIGFTF